MYNRDTLVSRFLTRLGQEYEAETTTMRTFSEAFGDALERFEVWDGIDLTGVEPHFQSDDETRVVGQVRQGDHVGFIVEALCHVTGTTRYDQWILQLSDNGEVSATGRRWNQALAFDGDALAVMASAWRDRCDALQAKAEAEARAARRELAEWLARYEMTPGVAEHERAQYDRAVGVVEAVVEGFERSAVRGDEEAIRGPGWWFVPIRQIGCRGYLVFDDGRSAGIGSGLNLRDWLWARVVGLDQRRPGPWSVRVSADLDGWNHCLPGLHRSTSRRLIERGEPLPIYWMELGELRSLVEGGHLEIAAID